MKKKLLLLLLLVSFVISAQEQYYYNVDLTADGAELKENLASKTIGAHTTFLSYTPGVWEALKITDLNPQSSSEVLLIYGFANSGTTARTSGINNNGGGQGEWNREHTYPKSLGIPNLGSTGPGADAHHLRPSDVSYNSQRGNLRFADGTGTSGSVSGGWYPGDEWKGDIARMMMYMYIRYGDRCKPNNVGNGSIANTGDDMIDLFLDWNAADPVSDFERQRNTHHDSNQTYAQGNRNPFIDNAYLATRIWGGTPAEDYWGIYTSNDSEAPTVPTNVTLSNVTTSSMSVSWTASTDNEAVTKYEIYANGNLNGETASTTYNAIGLNSNTLYAFSVLAKDLAGNESAKSPPVNGTTATDTTAPSVPNNVYITFITGTSFQVNWTASTDNTAVTSYDVYIDGVLNGAANGTNYTVSGLTISTDYSVRILAKDSANNQSAKSTAITATTTNGVNSVVELFFSEYAEGSGNNKALEIVNLTDNPIDLSAYSIKKQSNGAGDWVNELALSGSIAVNDVFVMIHFQADDATLVSEADLVAPQGSSYGAPINFNGNDAVGLFRDGTLIDIIGVLNESTKNFENMTLRRKLTITTPNTTHTGSEWDEYDANTFDGIGSYNATASIESVAFKTFKMYPNPTNGNTVYFKVGAKTKIKAYNVLGKLVQTAIIDSNNKSMDIARLAKGIYILRIQTENEFITQKLIKR